ncbi:MAG: hypothetical protein M3Z04_12350 [Chloroflexota bacterium]|nr:hypothetical protein [Chloroflexota bacterium]
MDWNWHRLRSNHDTVPSVMTSVVATSRLLDPAATKRRISSSRADSGSTSGG